MMREPVFSKGSLADLRCAHAWYEAQREGLGDGFMQSVEAAVAAVARDPERHRCVVARFRRVRLRRFPYAVYHCLEPSVIFIGAVHHASRDQARLITRLQNFDR